MLLHISPCSCRDKDEELGELTAERRKEISVKEAGSSGYRSTGNSYFRKEKALKIYTHADEMDTKATDEAQGSPNNHPSELN